MNRDLDELRRWVADGVQLNDYRHRWTDYDVASLMYYFAQHPEELEAWKALPLPKGMFANHPAEVDGAWEI